MKDFMKDQFDKILITYVLQIILILICIYKDSHDLVVFMMGALTTLLGSLTTLTHSRSDPSKNAVISEITPKNSSSTESGGSKSTPSISVTQ